MGEVRPTTEAVERIRAAEGPSRRLGHYLRTLREGYGYTLRKVEERALAIGEPIDNSQLSRFEKGKAVPSFDKLRALARVFNVPVQNFSDVLDLEEYQHLVPEAASGYEDLLRVGNDHLAQGDPAKAFAAFERALERTLEERTPNPEHVAEARTRVASALRALGKLYMTERELREVLKVPQELSPRSRMRGLLQLAYVYRELGDVYLASVMARECLRLAETLDEPLSRAGVLNSLGNMQYDDARYDLAAESYRESLALLEEGEGNGEMKANVLTNLGGCLVALGRRREGLTMLREAHARALRAGYRRVAALSLTRLAEAHMGEPAERPQAAELLRDSDSLAARPEETYTDILFLNTYHRWSMARSEGHSTREKIAFGRLRHLRSTLQRRFPEVEAFDRHVARNPR